MKKILFLLLIISFFVISLPCLANKFPTPTKKPKPTSTPTLTPTNTPTPTPIIVPVREINGSWTNPENMRVCDGITTQNDTPDVYEQYYEFFSVDPTNINTDKIIKWEYCAKAFGPYSFGYSHTDGLTLDGETNGDGDEYCFELNDCGSDECGFHSYVNNALINGGYVGAGILGEYAITNGKVDCFYLKLTLEAPLPTLTSTPISPTLTPTRKPKPTRKPSPTHKPTPSSRPPKPSKSP